MRLPALRNCEQIMSQRWDMAVQRLDRNSQVMRLDLTRLPLIFFNPSSVRFGSPSKTIQEKITRTRKSLFKCNL
jgi:hypothetical protein